MLHKYFTVGLHGKSKSELFASFSLGSVKEQTRREREKVHSQHGASWDRAGDGPGVLIWAFRSFDIRGTNPHIRAWFDLWRETEWDQSLSLKQESKACEIPE